MAEQPRIEASLQVHLINMFTTVSTAEKRDRFISI